MPPKVLLLQARVPGDPMREHEHACFVARTGLPPQAIVPHDLCEGPPSWARVRRCDALMIGGSGDFYVSRGNLPQFEAYLDLLRQVAETGYPTFASCFGFGGLIRALGGEMIHDPPNREVGTYELTLTEAAGSDPLFGTFPQRFWAQMGHKDRASQVGDGLVHLASSERCPVQAVRLSGKPVWATQFHPELDRTANLDRFRRYLEAYATASDADDLEVAFERFRESPQASGLLARFLELVLD